MKPRGCPRAFEVEALRDGRLVGKERRDFERHLGSCAVCAGEQRALEELARALRSDEQPEDELSLRRERVRLLGAFDRSLVEAEPDNYPARKWFILLAAAVAAVLLFLAWPSRQPTPLVTPGTQIEAAGGTLWSRRTSPQSDLVVLEQGQLRIRVVPAPRVGPLRVVLPDGELEDIGTVFSVEVESGHTTRVVVQEGAVLLRLRGRPPVTIRAKMDWRPTVEPAEPVSSPSSAARPSASGPAPERPLAPLGPPRVEPSAPASSAQSLEADPAAREFRAAMAAYRAGRNAEAAALLEHFVGRFPRDRRTQDAAYVRVLALQAAGQSEAMRSAAQDYLRRFPHGFRRSEVEKLAL